MTKNTFDNFYYNETYNIYHYSQLCGDNIKKYKFDADDKTGVLNCTYINPKFSRVNHKQ